MRDPNPFLIAIGVVGWISAAALFLLLRHAESFKEELFREWNDEMKVRHLAERQTLEALNQRDEALERIASFPKLWECPACAFEMNACHTDDAPGAEVYTCPACFAARADATIRRLLRASDARLTPARVRAALRELDDETTYPKDGAA